VKLPARGHAGGKVILLGEHAVVYDRPALAAGLALGVTVEIRAGTGPAVLTDAHDQASDPRSGRLLAAAADRLDVDPRGLVATVTSTLPAAVGFGSSAALTVAMLRALARATSRALTAEMELGLGRELEGLIFHGRSSGIDPAAAALGGCFRFQRGEPAVVTPLRAAVPLPLVLAWSGARRTQTTVAALRERWAADAARYDAIFDRIAAIVGEGVRAIVDGDLAALGAAFDANQAELVALGVSAPGVDEIVTRARAAGALGAKLTGGGGGGAVVALAPEPQPTAVALSAAGLETVVVMVGGTVEEAA